VYDYNATLVRIIDGDTVVLDFDLGLSTHRHASVRLAGIDAIERSDDPTGAAKQVVADWFEATEGRVIVKTMKDQKSFDRYIAHVNAKKVSKANVDWSPSLAKHMVDMGLAVEVDYS
jgi:micrococcal nuclease